MTNQLIKELYATTHDLHQVQPIVGFLRFSSIGALFLSFVVLAWSSVNPVVFVLATGLAGVLYAFWLICTHDMLHHTLTGWVWFERIAARLISYPMMWPYGLYAELHRLHHGWNGNDLRDPERVQWTWEEYQQASPLGQWYVRHQWAIDILVLGGFGMIGKTVVKAVQLQAVVPRIRTQFWVDCLGIVTIQGLLVSIVVMQGQGMRYLLFWLILERVIGVITQTRDHIEHYGLWEKPAYSQIAQHQLTQLYTCRNLQTSPLVVWLMGGLPYHAIHHAFPDIPFNRLSTAFERVQTVLQSSNLPALPLEEGYLKTTLALSQAPSLISAPRSVAATEHNPMVSG